MPGRENHPEQPDVSAFISGLRKSGLIGEDRIDAFLADLERVSAAGSDAATIAEKMVEAGMITQWQAGKLARGLHKGFFLGNFRLLDHLGTGGMSTVYLAEHSLTRQKRAIKVLPRGRINERSYLSRFYMEGRAVAALNHPNIVRIYDIGQEADRHYMVMEYMQGSDLYDIVGAGGPFEFDLAADCVIQAARGLAHAHDKNLIHRDIKPANLFRTDGSVVKVLDLGLALFKSEDDPQLSQQHNERTIGTADFLSPEQALNSHNVDLRCDIYSLGCTLFYLLTGRAPFNTGSLAQRIAMHQSQQPPRIGELRPGCPAYLAAACDRMMQKQPEARFDNCRDLIAALELKSRPIESFGRSTGNQGVTASETAVEVSKSNPTSTAARSSRRRKVPIGLWTGLGVLTLVPMVLAILALSQSGTRTAIQPSDPFTDSKAKIVSSEVSPEANAIHTPEAMRADPGIRADRSNIGKPEPAVANPDPNSTRWTLRVDFETPTDFPARRDAWNMIENGVFIGTLMTKKECQVVENPLPHRSPTGSYSLLLDGGSQHVEFRPENRNSGIEEVRFLARRVSSDSTCAFDIDAKSNLQFDRWRSVYSSGPDLGSDEFIEIRVGPERFGALESRKFRFRICGAATDGIQIDNLAIRLK